MAMVRQIILTLAALALLAGPAGAQSDAQLFDSVQVTLREQAARMERSARELSQLMSSMPEFEVDSALWFVALDKWSKELERRQEELLKLVDPKPDTWNAAIYPDRNNLLVSQDLGYFPTLKTCRAASRSNIGPSGGYDCGLNCKPHYDLFPRRGDHPAVVAQKIRAFEQNPLLAQTLVCERTERHR